MAHRCRYRWARPLLWLLLCLGIVASAHAQTCTTSVSTETCTIASGASVATIQSAINTVASYANGSGSTGIAMFSAGTYAVNAQITVPCHTSGTLYIMGPPTLYSSYVLSARPTATLNGSLTNTWMMALNTCHSTGATHINYLEFNGGQPSNGGGGNIYWSSGGVDNVSIQYNWFHGNWANTHTYPNSGQTTCPMSVATSGGTSYPGTCGQGHSYDALIYVDGVSSTTGGVNSDSNDLITDNIFGGSGPTGDCSETYGHHVYQGDGKGTNASPDSYDVSGGNCTALGMNSEVTNFTIARNNISYQEQCMKFFQPNSGSPPEFNQTGLAVANNTCSYFHRIGIEAQQRGISPGTQWINNVMMDPINPMYASWFFSLPQAGSGVDIESDNTGIYNFSCPTPGFTVDGYGCVGGAPAMFEYWGGAAGSHADNNLIQGLFPNGIDYGIGGQTTPLWTASNNNCQLTAGGRTSANCVTQEGTYGGASITPTISGNAFSTLLALQTSQAPSVSPSSTTFTGSQTVTMTDNGRTTGADPLGNHTIWYTTDGSTPVPKAGTAKVYTGPFAVTVTTTVKAVGMWGTPNQPAPSEYPSGYGWAASSVVTATYTSSGGAVTLSSITFTIPASSMTAGAATQTGTCTAHYSDGSSDDVTATADAHGYGPCLYTSSVPATATISSAAVITPLVAGNTNLSASLGVLGPIIVPLTVVSSGGGGGGATIAMGQSNEDVTGVTHANYFNAVYYVTGTATGGYTTGACHFLLPGTVATVGKHWDCLIVAAPSSTTEASTPLCKATYTVPSTPVPPGAVTITPTGCGTLPVSTAYWVDTITDDPNVPNIGWWDCGGSCSGSAPTSGAGTFPGHYVGVTYGAYTSLPSAMSVGTWQQNQYIDLTPASPTLTSAYQSNATNMNSLLVGATYTQHAYCVYSDGVTLDCSTTDARGSVVTNWSESSGGLVITIGAAGSGSSGVVTAINYGGSNTTCTVTGGIACNYPWTWTVTNTPATTVNVQGMNIQNMTIAP